MSLIKEIKRWLKKILYAVPGDIGCWVRNKTLPYKQGNNVLLREGGYIEFPENLIMGNNIEINQGFFINAYGSITIGNDVGIGPHTIIYSANHVYENTDIPIMKQGHVLKPVVIEDNVWIASKCVILPGVRIGKGSVVAAGSVVTKNIDPYTVVAGVPAKKIKHRKNEVE